MALEKGFMSSTLKHELTAENEEHFWQHTSKNIENNSISPIEKSFNPTSIKKVVEYLVMSRFSSEFNKQSSPKKSRKSTVVSSDDGSSSYSFDNNDFLKMALGSGELSELSSERNFPCCSGRSSDDLSIDTYNLSQLISTETLYRSKIGNTEQCVKRYEDSVQESSLETIESTIEYCETPSLEFLNQELSMTDRTMQQILKAVHYDDLSNKETLSNSRLEAEKLLLITDLKRELLLQEIKNPSSYDNNLLNVGTVDISRVRLWLDEAGHADQYFLCLLIHKYKIFASEISNNIKSNGVVYFKENFTVTELSDNFKITLRLFSMPVKKERKFNKHLICNQGDQPNDDIPFRTSLFTLCGEKEITISDIKQCRSSNLNNIQLQSSQCKLTACITGRATINLRLSAFLNVSQNKEGCPLWNRVWCVLNGNILNYYNYPLGEMYNDPKCIVDLTDCVGVRLPTREECVRRNTLLLKIKNREEVLNHFIHFNHFTDSKVEFYLWKKAIESIVSTISIWGSVY